MTTNILRYFKKPRVTMKKKTLSNLKRIKVKKTTNNNSRRSPQNCFRRSPCKDSKKQTCRPPKKQEKPYLEIEEATKALEALIQERKNSASTKKKEVLSKKQTPQISARPTWGVVKRCLRPWTIGDVYEYKEKQRQAAKKEKKAICGGRKIHPNKIDRIYRKQMRIKEWESKRTPKHCFRCLKKKWRSKLREKPIISKCMKEHRPGYFLTPTKSGRRFGASWAILQIVHQLNKQASPADILKLLKEKWGFPNFNTITLYSYLQWLAEKRLIKGKWKQHHRYLKFRIATRGKMFLKRKNVEGECCCPAVPNSMSIKTQWRQKLKDLFAHENNTK